MAKSVTRSRDLVEACWGKKWDEAIYILGGDDYDVLWGDGESFTALHWAANHGDVVMTMALLELGADPGAKNYRGRTPIMLACSGTHLGVIQLLISYGSPLPVTKLDGALPKGAVEYTDEVVEIIKQAKEKTVDERKAARGELPGMSDIERVVKIILSGEPRRMKDEETKRKQAERVAADAAREEQRLAEGKAHKERIARVQERKARERAMAETRAERKAMRADMIQLGMWVGHPLLGIAILWLLYSSFSFVQGFFDRHWTGTTCVFAFISVVYGVHMCIIAPLHRIPQLLLGTKTKKAHSS